MAAADPYDSDRIGLAATRELEPGIHLALFRAIDQLWATPEETAFAQAAFAKTKAAALRLKLQGDPKGLMDGDGSTDEGIETHAPTEHRATKGEKFEVVPTSNATGRDRGSEAWRAVQVLEGMHRRNQIDDAEKTAGERFYRDFVAGNRQGGLVARYGDMASGGTPVSQMTTRYVTDKDGQQVEVMGSEDRRQHHHTMWIRACEAIGMRRCPVTNNKHPGQTLHWMMQIVCEDYLLVEVKKAPTLEDAGRAFLGCKSPAQASSAGAALIKSGLERLVHHYGIREQCSKVGSNPTPSAQHIGSVRYIPS